MRVVFLLWAFLTCSLVFALDVSDLVPVQNAMESKAQLVLDTYFGPGNVIVNVAFVLHNTSLVKKISASEKNKLDSTPAEDTTLQPTINNLPGYALLTPKTKAYNQTTETQKESSEISIAKDIQSIEVTLIISSKIQPKDLEKAKQLVNEVLKLNVSRGDKISIVKMDFKKNDKEVKSYTQRMFETLKSNDFIKISLIYVMIVLAVILFLAIILIGLVLIASRTRSRQSTEQTAAQPTTTSQSPTDTTATAEGEDLSGLMQGKGQTPALTPPSAAVLEAGQLFSTLNETNIRKLSFLLRHEPIERKLATFNFLSPELGAKLIETFDVDVQKQLVQSLSHETKLTAQDVQSFVTEIESAFNYLVGGPAYTQEIFSHINPEVASAILQELEKEDKDLADSIASNIFVFGDLRYLDKSFVQSIVRSISVKEFSIAISAESEEFKAQLSGMLSEGVSELLKQSLSLLRKQPKSKIDEVKQHVVNLMRKLSQEGLIPSANDIRSAKKPTEPNAN